MRCQYGMEGLPEVRTKKRLFVKARDERGFLMRYRVAPPEVKMKIRTMLAKTGEEAHE